MCNTQTDVREELLTRVFPNSPWIQAGLTWLCGKAHAGQKLPQRRRWPVLVYGLMSVLSGVLISSLACQDLSAYWPLLILGMALTIAGARPLFLGVIHTASHENFLAREPWDTRIASAVAVLLLLPNFAHYKRTHLRQHHGLNTLSTDQDPTVQDLLAAGFRPGQSVPRLWWQVLWALISPGYHLRAFVKRLRGMYDGAGRGTRIATSAYLLMLMAIPVIYAWASDDAASAALTCVLAFLLPISWGYQSAYLLRALVEHSWPAPHEPRTAKTLAHHSQAVFCGCAPPPLTPQLGLRLWRWSLWTLRMIGHALTRMLVLPVDTPGHDIHHIGAPKAWPNDIAIRQREVEKRCAQGDVDFYREHWGMLTAIHHTLVSISAAEQVPSVVQVGKNRRVA